MSPDWFRYFAAVVLLCTPLRVLLRSRIRAHDCEGLLQKKLKPVRDLKRQPWLWIEVVRAYVGTSALKEGWGADVSAGWTSTLWIVSFAVLLFAVFMQMWSRRVDDVFFAPVSFCTGIVLALLPVGVALLSLVFAFSSLVAFRNWQAFFICGAFGSAGLGYLSIRLKPWLVVCVAALLTPAFLAWATDRSLRLPLRRIRVRHRGDSKAEAVEEEYEDA